MGVTAPPNASASRDVAPQTGSSLFFLYAALAGMCGSLSGVVGKVAVASTSVQHILQFFGYTSGAGEAYIMMALRVLFFASNAFFTGQMWRYYLKSLSLGPTPVCQIINTGTNFAMSAFMGIVFFGETVNMLWVAGAFLVVLGLGFVVLGSSTPFEVQENKKKD